MDPDADCPDDAALRGLVFGHPTPAGVADHFRGCGRCAARAADLDEAADDLVEAVRAARRAGPAVVAPPGYEILGDIDRGGMGAVYKARDGRVGRVVALKVLLAARLARPEYRTRFRAEAGAVAALSHPGVVGLYEFGDWDGLPFFALEYCPGGTLATRLAGAPLVPRAAADVAARLADAVAAAHARGIVHRDLKPSNVLFDAAGRPKVVDFGLAKLLGAEDGLTRPGAVIGTPSYMAPEQARGDSAAVGPAADVWALGAVLYECLTGRPPFRAASDHATLVQVREAEPVAPRALNPGVPADLETVCLKCLEKEPGRRYPTATALAADLGRFLRGEPVTARPVGLLHRAWKWARRRPAVSGLLMASGVLAAALAGVLAGYTVRLGAEVERANQNAAEADRQRGRAADNYRAARAALRRMLGRLDERQAGAIPRLKELRQDQLEDAVGFYEGVLAGLDDADPGVRLDAALAAVDVGTAQFALGRYAPAGEHFRRALAGLEALPPDHRTRPECRTGVVQCFNYLAHLAGGASAEVEAYFRKGHAEATDLVRDDPAAPAGLNTLARAEHNLGRLFQTTGRPDRAVPHYLRAVEIRDGLTGRDPGAAVYRADLGESLLNLAHLSAGTGRPADAAAAFGRAEGLLRPLAEAHPADDRYGLSLAGVYVNWGNLLRSQGDLPGALARYDRAVGLAAAAVAREPRFAEARSRALQAHGARALLHEQAGRLPAAVADWDQVVAMADDRERPDFRVGRAVRMARAGMHAGAAAEAHALAGAPGVSDESRYYLACTLAGAVEPALADPVLGALAGLVAGEAHATAALELLRRLHAAGFFRGPRTARLLTDDPGLQPLRARPDFRRLLADAAGGPKP